MNQKLHVYCKSCPCAKVIARRVFFCLKKREYSVKDQTSSGMWLKRGFVLKSRFDMNERKWFRFRNLSSLKMNLQSTLIIYSLVSMSLSLCLFIESNHFNSLYLYYREREHWDWIVDWVVFFDTFLTWIFKTESLDKLLWVCTILDDLSFCGRHRCWERAQNKFYIRGIEEIRCILISLEVSMFLNLIFEIVINCVILGLIKV